MSLKKNKKFIFAIVILASIAVLLVWLFKASRKELAAEREREQPFTSLSRVSVHQGERLITLDNLTQITSGISAILPEFISHQEEVKAYGTVLHPQGLIDLSCAYASAKAQAEKMTASLEASRQEYERLKVLHASNRNISDKALQAAEAIRISDEANSKSAREALGALKSTVLRQWGNVLAEWLFESSQALKRIIGQQDVLIQVTLPSEIRIPPPFYARIQAPDGTISSARLISPSPLTDPRIQGKSLFYLGPGQSGGLLPGMNILAYLPAGSISRGFLVPSSAVVWWQGKAWIYIQKGADHFVRREISSDVPIQSGWFVIKEISSGEKLVVKGAQLLLSEEFRSEIHVEEEGNKK